jgi:plasmid stabilization system protein ParE
VISYAFHPEAEQELTEATFFFELRRTGLGISFKNAVETAIVLICEYPELGSPLDDIRRRMIVHGFPYAVVYEHTNDTIFILAIAHARRRPNYWHGRM